MQLQFELAAGGEGGAEVWVLGQELVEEFATRFRATGDVPGEGELHQQVGIVGPASSQVFEDRYGVGGLRILDQRIGEQEPRLVVRVACQCGPKVVDGVAERVS